jgi:DNA-directed RNA polymerase specialized sigma subunit
MTLEELYLEEKDRIAKLSRHYARIFRTEKEDLFQEGVLALAETYAKYADKLQDSELLKISHRIVNRTMYRYAKNEYRQKIQNKYRQI